MFICAWKSHFTDYPLEENQEGLCFSFLLEKGASKSRRKSDLDCDDQSVDRIFRKIYFLFLRGERERGKKERR